MPQHVLQVFGVYLSTIFPGSSPNHEDTALPVHRHPKRNEGQQGRFQLSFSETWGGLVEFFSPAFMVSWAAASRHRGNFFQQDPEFKKAVPETKKGNLENHHYDNNNNNNNNNNKQQTTNNKQQTTNNKQQTTNNKQQTTNNKQQTTNNKQQTTNNKQQTTNNNNNRSSSGDSDSHKQPQTDNVVFIRQWLISD